MINRVNNKVTMAIQKNFSFVAFFIPFYFVIPNNLLTHTHTHTFKQQFLRARKIHHKVLQTKGVQEVF